MTVVDNVQKYSTSRLSDQDDLSLPKHSPALDDPLIAPPSLFQKRPSQTTSNQFEETYKTSYSHGLENIYAIETIDVKSIKKLELPTKKASAKKKAKHCFSEQKQQQLELNLGVAFAKTIESFLPREPIQVLGLFRHAEKCLLENGKKVLKDLLDVDLQEFIFFKGMGQGYIDEISSKLAAYIEGRPLFETETVDFASWIKSLVGALDRKKTGAILQQFNLEALIELSAAETIEVSRMPLEQIAEYRHELFTLLRQQGKVQFLQDFQQLINVFVKPWIRGREGIATEEEVLERLEKVSVDPTLVSPALAFFDALFEQQGVLLHQTLPSIDDNLFSADNYVKRHYNWVNKSASSYFYKAGICYPLAQLVSLIEREMAREWVSVQNNFVEKALRYSPLFRVRKERSGHLVIRLA